MSTIFHCIKLRLSECNGSLVVVIKQKVNFKYKPPAMFVFFFIFEKIALLKVVHPLKIYHNTKFSGPTLSDANFAITSEVWTSVILDLLQLQH
jgi:hypothetical protein